MSDPRGSSIVLALILLAASAAGGPAAASSREVVTRGVIRPPDLPQPPRPSATDGGVRIVAQEEMGAWLKGLLDALREHTTRDKAQGSAVTYRVRVIDHDSINAAAMADGRIYLTRGLLQFVRSDDELAGVVAHECAHVECRHHPKRGMKQLLWSGLALLGAALAHAEREGFVGAQLLGSLATLSYSRNQELEADRVGFGILRSAGYDPRAMGDFMERLEEEEAREAREAKESDTPERYQVSPWFSSHPATKDRVVRLRGLEERNPGTYGPRALSYDPDSLFCAPLEWGRLPGTPVPGGPAPVGGEGDLLGRGDFDSASGLVGWRVEGEGSHRLVGAMAGIGAGCLKLWASGGSGLRLWSPPVAGLVGDSVVEFLAAGPRADALVCSVEAGDGRLVALELETVAIRGPWRLLRAPVGGAFDGDGGSGSSRILVELPAGVRGTAWVDEIRVGRPVERRILTAPRLPGDRIAGGDFASAEALAGWEVEGGSLSWSSQGEREVPGSLVLRTDPEGLRVVLRSPPLPARGLEGGYLLAASVRGDPKVRVYGGVEPVAAAPSPTTSEPGGAEAWTPAGGATLDEGWTPARFTGTVDAAGVDLLRCRIEFVAPRPGVAVVVDDVSLVPLLRSGSGRSVSGP